MKKRIALVFIILGIAVGTWFFNSGLLVNWLRSELEAVLSNALNSPASIDKLKINLLSGRIDVREIAIGQHTSKNKAVRFRSVSFVPKLLPLLEKRVEIPHIIVTRPGFRVHST